MRWNCCFPILFCMTVSYNCLIFYTFIPYLYKTYRSHLPNLLNLPTRTYSTLPALLVSTTSIYSIEWIYRINPSRSLFIIYSFILLSIHPSIHPCIHPWIHRSNPPTYIFLRSFCLSICTVYVFWTFGSQCYCHFTSILGHCQGQFWHSKGMLSRESKERLRCPLPGIRSDFAKGAARFSKWWSEAIDVVVVISPL